MNFKQITRIPVGADLSAFAGCSAIPLNLLKLIKSYANNKYISK
jgi:hypothetical protein